MGTHRTRAGAGPANASNQMIEVDLSVFSRFRLPAVIAFVVFAKQLIGVSHGLQGCGIRIIVLALFRENMVRCVPFLKAKPRDRLQKIWPYASQQNGNSVLLRILQEMFDSFEADHIGIAHSLQAQHNETCALLDGAPPQLIKSVVEFWCGAKKKLSF